MSKVMIVKCDRCGAEITDKHTYKLWPQVADLDGGICQTQPFESEQQRDYCANCLEVALDFLHTAPESEELPPPQCQKGTREENQETTEKGTGYGQSTCLEKSGLDECKDCRRDGSERSNALCSPEGVYRVQVGYRLQDGRLIQEVQ